jgi:YhcH/YjgK/YiaL family protein
MIFDLLANRALYRPISDRLALGLDWLSRFSPDTPDSRIEIDGPRVFAMIQSYQTEPAAARRFETHRDHIDIQYIFQGTELMLCAPVGSLPGAVPYDPAKDATFYGDPADATAIHCVPGSFTVFFTHDGHKGGCADGSPSAVRKVVIKVRV